jgi:hypothetical protein
MLALRQIVVASCHCDDSFCMMYKKKKGSSQQMVSEQLVLGLLGSLGLC